MNIKNFIILILLISPLFLYTMEQRQAIGNTPEARDAKADQAKSAGADYVEFEDLNEQKKEEQPRSSSYIPYEYKYENFTRRDKIKSLLKGAFKGTTGAVALWGGILAFYNAFKNSKSTRKVWVGIGGIYSAIVTYCASINNFFMVPPSYSNRYRISKLAGLDQKMKIILHRNEEIEKRQDSLKQVINQVSLKPSTKDHAPIQDQKVNNCKRYFLYTEQLLNNEYCISKNIKQVEKKERECCKAASGILLGDDLRYQTIGYYAAALSTSIVFAALGMRHAIKK